MHARASAPSKGATKADAKKYGKHVVIWGNTGRTCPDVGIEGPSNIYKALVGLEE